MKPPKSLDEIIEWPVSVMKGCLIDNPDFTGEIYSKFASGGISTVKVSEYKANPRKVKSDED